MNRTQRSAKALYLALAVTLMPLGGCIGMTVGSGPSMDQDRQAGDFTRVASEGSIDVDLTVGPATSLRVEAEENLLPKIKTEIKDGTLHIDVDGSFATGKGIRVVATTPELTAVSVAGSGDILVKGAAGPSLSLAISGSGTIDARGAVDSLSVVVSGSGDLRGFELPAQSVSATVSGSGDADVNAAASLNAVVSGSGDIRYKGSPSVNKTISGSGSVSPAR